MLAGGSASWGKCQLGNFNMSDFLGTIFIFNSSFNDKYLNIRRTPPRTLISAFLKYIQKSTLFFLLFEGVVNRARKNIGIFYENYEKLSL